MIKFSLKGKLFSSSSVPYNSLFKSTEGCCFVDVFNNSSVVHSLNLFFYFSCVFFVLRVFLTPLFDGS